VRQFGPYLPFLFFFENCDILILLREDRKVFTAGESIVYGISIVEQLSKKIITTEIDLSGKDKF
jgi:hypothetical protein